MTNVSVGETLGNLNGVDKTADSFEITGPSQITGSNSLTATSGGVSINNATVSVNNGATLDIKSQTGTNVTNATLAITNENLPNSVTINGGITFGENCSLFVDAAFDGGSSANAKDVLHADRMVFSRGGLIQGSGTFLSGEMILSNTTINVAKNRKMKFEQDRIHTQLPNNQKKLDLSSATSNVAEGARLWLDADDIDLSNSNITVNKNGYLEVGGQTPVLRIGNATIAGYFGRYQGWTYSQHLLFSGALTLEPESDYGTIIAFKDITADEHASLVVKSHYGIMDCGDSTGNFIDLTKITPVIESSSQFYINGKDVRLDKAKVYGTLSLTNATLTHVPNVTLYGDWPGAGVLMLSANTDSGRTVPQVNVIAEGNNNTIFTNLLGATEPALSPADFSNVGMVIGSQKVLNLDLNYEENRTYKNIAAVASVNNQGDLHLFGENVKFNIGEYYSGDGVVSFDSASASRTLTTDKDSFERVLANGSFKIGDTATATNNVFEITGTDTTAVDLSSVLAEGNGWFNLQQTANTAGAGKISGDGVIKTTEAKIGNAYRDGRIALDVKTLSSDQDTVSIGGHVTASDALEFASVNRLNLENHGVFTIGDANAENKFNLAHADVNFTGGKLVVLSKAPNPAPTIVDDRNSTAVTVLDTPTLSVKSLDFAADAPAGSLMINSGAQVRVVGDAADYTKRYFNANGNQTNGLVTLDGSGSMLVVSAKDFLRGNGTGKYTAADHAGIIGGYGTLNIENFVDFARHDQGLADGVNPKLNLTQLIEMRKELVAVGNTAGAGKPYNVLLKFNLNEVDGFMEPDQNINRQEQDKKDFLDNGLSASGSLVYNVAQNEPSANPDGRQEWGAAKNLDGVSDLLIGVSGSTGTVKDLTLDTAGAGKAPLETDKKYFVRYDSEAGNDQLGNIKYVGADASGTLVRGGVIGSITAETGASNASHTFYNSKADAGQAVDADHRKGFASGSINIPGKVAADNADVVIGLENRLPANADRDAGNLTATDLIVKNNSSFTIKGETKLNNVFMGNDDGSNFGGSTNKVDFENKAIIGNIVADGSKVTDGKAGLEGKAEVNFKGTDASTVNTVTVAGNNSLAINGNATVNGATKVEGTLYTDVNVRLNGGLTVAGEAASPAHAYVQSGSLQSATTVGGAAGNGFLYLGSTQDVMEAPNTIEKNWKDSHAALADRNPGSSYTGIGYLDEDGYDISNAQVNIGSVAGGANGTLTIGSGGALIVTDQALKAPEEGQWNYTAGLKGNIANDGGTVLIGDLKKIGAQTTIKLASGTVTGTDDAKWLSKNALYTLTLKDDGILYASVSKANVDNLLSKTDKDLADKITDQANKDQNAGGGFDSGRNDGLGFISKVLEDTVKSDTGIDAEATADRIGNTLSSLTRFGLLSGAVQNSQLVSDMATAQIEERAGFRTATASRFAADNSENGAIWVSPLYNKNRSSGLQAGHFAYGVDADMNGLSFGGDVKVADGYRIGAAFTGGNGDSKSCGSMMHTKNDFDFYGGSLYAITDLGSVTVLADLDYSWLKGDVTQTNGISTLKGTVKSDILSLGVSAKRSFETGQGTTVAPYAGIRVNRMHINGYDVKDANGNAIIESGAQTQYFATVPVGVQVSNNLVLAQGFIKPTLDLGLVTMIGSRHMESKVTYTGFTETTATSEVRDRLSFTAKFGLNGEVGNFGFGLGYGFIGSSSLKSNQLYGNVRYRF